VHAAFLRAAAASRISRSETIVRLKIMEAPLTILPSRIIGNDDRDSPPFPADARVPLVEVAEDTFNVESIGIPFSKALI
jgi:hypothetical protein